MNEYFYREEQYKFIIEILTDNIPQWDELEEYFSAALIVYQCEFEGEIP